MGSRALERSGHRVRPTTHAATARSSAAPDRRATTATTTSPPTSRAVLDELELDRAVLAGASMGAHTIAPPRADQPGPGGGHGPRHARFDPATADDEHRLAHWDALADGLRAGGIEGFVAAYNDPPVPEAHRDTVLAILRQRLSRHHDLDAVADALQSMPRSHPFEALGRPVRARRPDRRRRQPRRGRPRPPPRRSARAWAEAIPGARFLVEEEGRSPLAWQGAQLSRVIAELASATARAGGLA